MNDSMTIVDDSCTNWVPRTYREWSAVAYQKEYDHYRPPADGFSRFSPHVICNARYIIFLLLVYIII